MCKGSTLALDCPVRLTSAHYLGSRSPVHVPIVVIGVLTLWFQGSADHGAPPSGQWAGRKIPPSSQVKARLKDANWSDELPWVMLGIRSAPKGDLGCSPAELVYGSPFTVPGEFLHSPLDPSPTSHLCQLRKFAGNLSPVPTSRHGTVTPYIPRSIGAAEFVLCSRGHQQDSATSSLYLSLIHI